MNTYTQTPQNGVRPEQDETDTTASVPRDKIASTLKQLDEWWNVGSLESKVRNHPLAFILTGSGILLAIAGGVTMAVLENQRKNTLACKIKSGMKQALRMF